MLTTKLTGERVPEFDDKVIEFLESNEFNNPDDHAMVIGIDNHKDKLYRVIEVTGADDYVFVIEFLEGLNMVDVLMLGIRIRTKRCINRFRQFEAIDISKFGHNLDARSY